MTAPGTMQIPGGMVAMTSWGMWTSDTSMCWSAMREAAARAGINALWVCIPGSLVDRARNQAVAQMLNHQPALGWLLFVDGDAVFHQDALAKLLTYAYAENPLADAVGGYATLRGEPYLPTIDTGTGTWESHLPGVGPIEVMRTGSAFILLKRHCFERIEAPWYGTRNPMRPLDAMAEVDNFAHTKFDGRNPFADSAEWQALLKCARDSTPNATVDPTAFVGEDSNWCDRMRFAGLRIFVQTDVQVDHSERAVRSAADHAEAMKKRDGWARTAVGVLR